MLKTTAYFEDFAAQKHPEVQRKWIQAVLLNSVKIARQSNGRVSYWGNIPDAENRVLRVIALEDGETVHNAFFDRNFYRRQQRGEEPG
ncbi:hypothetical protein ACQ4N7_05570 [Nodosilinea sp. AN01ver1]|uniref:hypothetical protein n=1 Tax=Nodosilinea sp. AN01ver1 TaxID=3423362 RepID=UPI003D31BA80